MDPKVAKLEQEFKSIEERLSAGGVPPGEMKELSRRHAELSPVAARARELAAVEKELADVEGWLAGGDADMKELALSEKPRLSERQKALESQLRLDLIPKDPNAGKSVFLEIRAGAGGDEAALFAGELLRAYTRFGETR